MIKATFVRQLEGWISDARLYRLSEPVDHERSGSKFDHVIVSAVDAPFSGPETYIFPARASDDPAGDVIDYGELEGSYRGGRSHARAIRNAGWELEVQS